MGFLTFCCLNWLVSQINYFCLILTLLLPVGTQYYCECMQDCYSHFLKENSCNNLGNVNQGFQGWWWMHLHSSTLNIQTLYRTGKQPFYLKKCSFCCSFIFNILRFKFTLDYNFWQGNANGTYIAYGRLVAEEISNGRLFWNWSVMFYLYSWLFFVFSVNCFSCLLPTYLNIYQYILTHQIVSGTRRLPISYNASFHWNMSTPGGCCFNPRYSFF